MPCPKRIGNENIFGKFGSENQAANNFGEAEKEIPPGGSEQCQNTEKEGIESSTRFSIRVMEAMRSLQRKNSDRSLTSSNIRDIAEYIKANYNFDGDLDAQVRTVVSRIWRQGFIMKTNEDDYLLMGPFASYMNEVHSNLRTRSFCKRRRKSRPKSKSSGESISKKRKKERKSKKKLKNRNPCLKIINDSELRNLEEDMPENKNASGSKHSSNDEKKCSKNRSRSLKNRTRRHSRNRRKSRSKKSKEQKRRACLSGKPGCGCGRSHENNQAEADLQSEISKNSFVTCEEISPEKSKIKNKILKTDLNLREDYLNTPGEMNKDLSDSYDGSSNDSVYQKIKSKYSKTAYNSKDLKKWIRHCRQDRTDN